MGILHDIVSVLQDDLLIMKKNEENGHYKDKRRESVEAFIQQIQENENYKEEEK